MSEEQKASDRDRLGNEFRGMLKEAFDKGIQERDFFDKFGVSFSTIKRWRTGESMPHPVTRPLIAEFLREFPYPQPE